MEGGIHAWKGLRATGAPEAGMAYFDPAKTPEEMIALAWILEDGSSKFYRKMGEVDDTGGMTLFRELSADEERHKLSLFKAYERLSPKGPDPGFPRSLLSLESGADYLEGGIVLSKALEWAQGKDLKEVLEFSISLEANALDLYIKMQRQVRGNESKDVFQLLSNQERNHLQRLTAALEKG